ncbi:MAG: hypothetical protein IPO02_09795 [Bacteroidetes bacterium]|nr:hypothetical protein [Bacteroidota bacterium]
MGTQEHKWLRKKGYLHVTNQIDVNAHRNDLLSKLKNKDFIAKYSFFPLIHSSIKERKYKRVPDSTLRGHSYTKGDKHYKTAKERPLHYATHMDALIFGYYGELLGKVYQDRLNTLPTVNEAVTAYRRIPTLKVSSKGRCILQKKFFLKLKTVVNLRLVLF